MEKRERTLRNQIDDVKTDEAIMEKIAKGKITPHPGFYGGVNPTVTSYPAASRPSAFLNVGGRTDGWIGMFGEHYLCEVGCKKFVSKKLDDVIKFIEKEIRHWWQPKDKVAKKDSGVEVKSYVRKPRKKKDVKEEKEIREKLFDKEMDYVEKQKASMTDIDVKE